MAGRYLISGTEIGMLKAFVKSFQSGLYPDAALAPKEAEKLLNEIIEKQFIGNSENSIREDAKKICGILEKER